MLRGLFLSKNGGKPWKIPKSIDKTGILFMPKAILKYFDSTVRE